MSDNKKYRTGFEMNLENSQQKTGSLAHEGDNKPMASNTDPLCIAVLGDFSGRDNKQRYEPETISKRRLIAVDRDNIEDVLASFDIKLQLWLEEDSDEPIDIPIKELDDFHPDQLYQNVEVFSQLRALRNRLKNNKTFAEAAKELQVWHTGGDKAADSRPAQQAQELDDALSPENLLESMFEASHDMQSSSGTASGSAMVDNLVKKIVAPYVEAKTDPRQEDMIAAVDQAISAHMQFILHHPDFQAMEAAWRSLDFLVSRVETGQRVKLYILDVAKHELEVDLSEDNVTQTALYKKFCDPAPGDVSWGLLLGNYCFTDRVEEIMTLLQIGAVARKAQAPFMTAANETLIGCESFAITPDVDDWHYQMQPEVESAWSLLRESDEADYLAMVVPGFLLRAPYGKKSKPIEAFAFEEMPEVPCHSCYLWGNGAFIKAEQMARAFIKDGWDMNPAHASQIDRLPLHYYKDEGETTAKPCAEVQLTEQGGRRILQQGLIPLWSVKNSDRIRSSDFNSLAV